VASPVRILHGKGTGALRQAIREQLAHHALVRSYAAADAKEGGERVTVVTLPSSCYAPSGDSVVGRLGCQALDPFGV